MVSIAAAAHARHLKKVEIPEILGFRGMLGESKNLENQGIAVEQVYEYFIS